MLIIIKSVSFFLSKALKKYSKIIIFLRKKFPNFPIASKVLPNTVTRPKKCCKQALDVQPRERI